MEKLEIAVRLSVVVPAFNEEDNIIPLYENVKDVLSGLDMTWEIIIVDDGSTDNTWQRVVSLNDKDKRVKGILFSRNFGHQYALFAGLSKAAGDGVVSMDADLQHPPVVISKLVREWQNGKKIVHTVRSNDSNVSFIKKITSDVFYKIYSLLSGVHIEGGMADFRLLDRQVVNNILAFREEGLFLRGMVNWVGYSSAKVSYKPDTRRSGRPKYTLGKMMRFSGVGITAFSIIPLRIGVFIGLLTSAIAFTELLYVLFIKVVKNSAIPGWASAVGIISLLFGILFILVGLLGEYIGRILIEVQNRPRFIIHKEI